MSDDYFFHIRSSKFHILPGEEQELINPGMYGKSLSLYLQEHLQQQGWTASYLSCEDWGWWVGIEAPIEVVVCVYNCAHAAPPNEYVICDGMSHTRRWSFRSFSFVDYTPLRDKLRNDLLVILSSDPGIEFLGIRMDMP